jgi:flagellar hook protein FlgE
MVSMIQHQRAFSANSKIIATADDMLAELMQLKR